MLGDGHISRGDISKYPNINARLQFTFSVQNLPYLRYLKFVVYASICTLTEPTPWPNPELTGKRSHNIDFLLNNYLCLLNCIKFDTRYLMENLLKFYHQILKSY